MFPFGLGLRGTRGVGAAVAFGLGIYAAPLPPIGGLVPIAPGGQTAKWAQDVGQLARLHAQDQELVEVLVALTTEGFFDGTV